jgi:hypothetical protein
VGRNVASELGLLTGDVFKLLLLQELDKLQARERQARQNRLKRKLPGRVRTALVAESNTYSPTAESPKPKAESQLL